MIQHQELFLDFIVSQGVGAKDLVASSPKSYISYLNSVAKFIGSDVTPAILRTDSDVENIASRISGIRKESTIRNYCSAMRQYVAMVKSRGL